MNFYFFFLFILLIKESFLENKIVKFKFEIYPINIAGIESLKSFISYWPSSLNRIALNDYIFRLFTDNFYFNLTLGTPPQIIPTIWNMHQYSFKLYNNSINKNNSSTFKNISEVFRYNFDESSNAIFCEEIFSFKDENNNSFSNIMSFMNLDVKEKNYGFVGLELPDYPEDGLLTFIRSLKKYNIINKYIFFIYYNSNQNINDITNYNGYLYFGEYPHNIKEFNNKFSENNFYEIKSSYRSRLVFWDISFDNIYFGDKYYFLQSKQAEICGDMRLSIGTDEYKDFISKNFFDKYVNNSICHLKTILNETDYMYYECLNNKELFDITTFPSLNFELRELNFNFSFGFEDLFFEHDNYIYFGIVFDKYYKLKYSQRWKLGSILFKKYLLTFNQDTKMIGIYKNIIKKNKYDFFKDKSTNEIKNKNSNKSNYKNWVFIKIVIIICMLFVFVFLGIALKKYIYICGNKNSKNINYNKKSLAHSSKNKNEVHEYYEMGNNLID